MGKRLMERMARTTATENGGKSTEIVWSPPATDLRAVEAMTTTRATATLAPEAAATFSHSKWRMPPRGALAPGRLVLRVFSVISQNNLKSNGQHSIQMSL